MGNKVMYDGNKLLCMMGNNVCSVLLSKPYQPTFTDITSL